MEEAKEGVKKHACLGKLQPGRVHLLTPPSLQLYLVLENEENEPRHRGLWIDPQSLPAHCNCPSVPPDNPTTFSWAFHTMYSRYSDLHTIFLINVSWLPFSFKFSLKVGRLCFWSNFGFVVPCIDVLLITEHVLYMRAQSRVPVLWARIHLYQHVSAITATSRVTSLSYECSAFFCSSLYLPTPRAATVLGSLHNFSFSRWPYICDHMVNGLASLASSAHQRHPIPLCVVSWLDCPFLFSTE